MIRDRQVKCLGLLKLTIPCKYDPTSALVSHQRPQWQMPSASQTMFLSVLLDVWERDRFSTLIRVLFSNAWQFISQLHHDRSNCRVYWIETNNWHCFWFGFHKKPSFEETLGELGSKFPPCCISAKQYHNISQFIFNPILGVSAL